MVKKVAKNVKMEAPATTGAEGEGKDEAATAAPKPPAPKQEIYYKSLRARTAEDKLPTQAQAIVDHLVALDTKQEGISRVAFVESLEKNEVLTTKQPVERIVSYYQSKLMAMGLIEHGRRSAE